MTIKEPIEAISRAMSDPAFYPHGVSFLERRETHISIVFLTGKWVYKLKKPLLFDFLDFRKLEARKKFCEQEVVLNQRLSKGIYQEVVSIHEDENGHISLRPDGKIIEYAVKMLQLQEKRNLKELVRKNAVSPGHMESLGVMLSEFYEAASQNSEIEEYGRYETISYNMEENFKEIKPFVKSLVDSERWDFISQVCRSFLEDHIKLFKCRIKTGRIRDGHGDLKADHIYFENGIQIIDCIEFNNRFRYGDAAIDLAFLHMDLEHLGRPDLGDLFLSTYARRAKDPEIYALIDFYAAYRALVRLKVCCFSHEQVEKEKRFPLKKEIKRYLDQAYEYAILLGRPTLWIVFGLPATGKSTLARKLADALFIPIFQSDVVRKQVFSKKPDDVVPYNTGIYRPVQKGRVYAHLLALAQENLKMGKSVILDATFSDLKWRTAAQRLAEDMDINLLFVECICKTETILSRLKQREYKPSESDARLSHYNELVKNMAPFKTTIPATHFSINTDQPVDQAVIKVLSKGYALKRVQVKNRAEIDLNAD